eukprot:8555038-Pyramimonas_sp.AAC.1
MLTSRGRNAPTWTDATCNACVRSIVSVVGLGCGEVSRKGGPGGLPLIRCMKLRATRSAVSRAIAAYHIRKDKQRAHSQKVVVRESIRAEP